ncbi:MAG: M56 family metallopeptidase [Saprospiraceae bacterium]
MNLTTHWMQSDWCKALGWTFVHSLWQIAAIGLLLYIILRLIPGRSAHVRYTISTMAIWMIVITVLSTFIIMLPESNTIAESNGQLILVKIAGAYTLTDRISMWLETRMPMMLSIWFVGVIILMLRLAFSLIWVQYMRSVAAPLIPIQNVLNDLIYRLQIKIKPIISESGYVSSPVTIGHIKPVILFPIGIINQLNPQEVEAILTHELAHIIRRDYLSNLIQSFIETIFYYHPVTWWISNKVRTERENRADDLAISWCGDHVGYAKALITVQEMELGNAPSLAIGFASGKGAMLARIQRILHIPYKNHNQMEKTVLISLCSLFFLGFTLNSHTIPDQKNEKSSTPAEIVNVEVTSSDSIPSKGTYMIHKKTDSQDISIQVEDGDIKELKVDGKKIAPEQFNHYDEVIDELFGSMEAPPSADGFNFTMPAMPPMPLMPAMPDVPAMPGMHVMPCVPPMPPMPAMGMNEMELERMLGNGSNLEFLKANNLDNFIRGQMGDLMYLSDTLSPMDAKIIIIRNGDSTVISSPGFGWSALDLNNADSPVYKLDKDQWKKQQEEWKQNQEEWKEHQKEWKKNWEENAENWKSNWQEQQPPQMEAERERMRSEGDRMREEGDHMRAEGKRIREQSELNNNPNAFSGALADGLRREALGSNGVYGFLAPRMNMTDELIGEGLVQPGEEADILLTPDKLKINGKKMPENIHQKYLRMYEEQQGVELSGNSRVEFKTKSRRSM